MKENFFEKNEKMYFWQKPQGVILHDGNFDSTKSSLYSCFTLGRRMVFVSIFSSEKIQLQIEKNMENFLKNFFITLFAEKVKSEKIRHHF